MTALFCFYKKVMSFGKNYLYSCSEWVVEDKLSLHVVVFFFFVPEGIISKLKDFCITRNGHTIKSQTSVKYFGFFYSFCTVTLMFLIST